MMNLVKKFNTFGDNRGKLTVCEENIDIPFSIQRIFYLFGMKEKTSRGNHAHYKTEQFLVAIAGNCKVTLNDGVHEKTYDLNEPNIGLLQKSMVWGTMHDFSENCILLVFASELYDENDYINNYNQFMEEVTT